MHAAIASQGNPPPEAQFSYARNCNVGTFDAHSETKSEAKRLADLRFVD